MGSVPSRERDDSPTPSGSRKKESPSLNSTPSHGIAFGASRPSLGTPPLVPGAVTSLSREELLSLMVKVSKRLQSMEKKLTLVAQSRAALAVGLEGVVCMRASYEPMFDFNDDSMREKD